MEAQVCAEKCKIVKWFILNSLGAFYTNQSKNID